MPHLPADAFLSSNAVRFVVEESFRNVGAPGTEVTVYTGSSGGDCGYPFVAGESYLAYAEPGTADGVLHTGICSATAPATNAAGVLRELRATRDHKPLDDLFGTIFVASWGRSWFTDRPLAGVQVQLTGPSGTAYSSRTDDQGVYAFSRLEFRLFLLRLALLELAAQTLARPTTESVQAATNPGKLMVKSSAIERCLYAAQP